MEQADAECAIAGRHLAGRDAAWLVRVRLRPTAALGRLETLDYYDVTSDGDDSHRYLRGEPAPTAAAKQPWWHQHPEHHRDRTA
ncbi:MAG TPA: hypothetical protein VGO16_11230 [Pseudonocardiaceae bacterium]|nr:hypothetical protein [Pseudonocardiaceae bacterium]